MCYYCEQNPENSVLKLLVVHKLLGVKVCLFHALKRDATALKIKEFEKFISM